MTLSRHPQLSEELLSAYLDNEVTAEERALIEATIATDPAVAWQVASLRQTVQLLHALPPLVLPRSFAIEALVATTQQPAAVSIPKLKGVTPPKPTHVQKENYWWQSLAQLWQGGNPYLRNATAVAFTLLIVLFASDQLIAPYPQAVPQLSGSTAQVAISSPTVAAVVNYTAPATTEMVVATTSGAVNEMAVPENDARANQSGNRADPQVTATGSATLLSVPPAAPATAKRMQQEDTLDITGSGADASLAQGSPIQGSGGGSSEMNTTADGSRAGIMQSQAASPLALAAAVEQPIATPSSSAGVTVSQVLTDGLAITTTEPVAIRAADASMTEFAPVTKTVTETVTATVMVTPSAAQPTAVTINTVTINTAAAEPARATEDVDRWLAWAQIVTVLFTVVLGSLWWRSKG